MTEFRKLIERKICKLFLVVWAPWGEEKESDIDISFGFVFEDEPSRLCVISVDKNELWMPHVFYQSLPQNIYTWEDFYPRIKMWMGAEDDLNSTTIFQDFNESCLFFTSFFIC